MDTLCFNKDYYDADLDSLKVSDKYAKLVKRIRSSSNEEPVKKISDIINLDSNEFASRSGVGKLYVDMLIDFKKDLPNIYEMNQLELETLEQEDVFLEEAIFSKLYLNYNFLNDVETKQLKKLQKFFGKDVDVYNVSFLLNIDKVDLAGNDGFGKLFLTELTRLQDKIKKEIKLLDDNLIDSCFESAGLFFSGEIKFIEFHKIDAILIEDVESYLWSLDEINRDTALSRWGFNQKHQTLEELGVRYQLARERIRQLEKSINSNLGLSLRIRPNVLWANIREKMTEDLVLLLPNLAKCFESDKLFYSFVELCCHIDSGSIFNIAFPKIRNDIFDDYFCNNPSPVSKDVLINELMSNYGFCQASAINAIKELERQGILYIIEDSIFPRKMGKYEAVAHVLVSYPAGLPWKDVAKIINIKGYSAKSFNENRQEHGFNDSEYVYLCSQGTFRNLMFLDIGQFDIPEIMQNLLDYFKQNQLKILHLNDYFFQSKSSKREIEYFTLRYLVREFGEGYGLYFNGKSGTDSVSLDPKVSLISQSDVIIKVLNESKNALTKQEIAERLRSKSKNHAAFYINNLMEEGKVIRVDQLVYTTPEKAFKNLDDKAVMRLIKDVMNMSDTIVEADVFREHINMDLNLSYSKYFYAGLLRTRIAELGWHRRGNLFSKELIKYESLADLTRKVCNPELSNSQNIEILRDAVLLTRSVALEAMNWWRWALSH